MADSDAERTEEATERQRERFRKEGKVATSKELVASITLAVSVLTALVAVPWIGESMVNLFRTMLARGSTGTFTPNEVPRLLGEIAMSAGPAILLVLVPATIATVATGMAATGFNVADEVIDLKWERIDPLGSAQSMFLSRQPFVQLAKGLIVGTVIAWSVYAAVVRQLDVLPMTAHWGLGGQASFLRALTIDVAKRAIPASLAIGAIDYVYQRWNLSQQMMMTRQEVKDEFKQSEGDPTMKAKRKARARQLVMSRQLQDVRRADVVVTNPTHYAVALRYRKEENAAPVILARGVDAMALKIRIEAVKHDVPVLENRPLARGLHAAGRAGRPIPPDLFGPVAQVLAVVYRRRKPRAEEAPPTPRMRRGQGRGRRTR
jgi:flagellar biosynthetic protein FlhB